MRYPHCYKIQDEMDSGTPAFVEKHKGVHALKRWSLDKCACRNEMETRASGWVVDKMFGSWADYLQHEREIREKAGVA